MKQLEYLRKLKVPATFYALLLFRVACISCPPQGTLCQSYLCIPPFCSWQH